MYTIHIITILYIRTFLKFQSLIVHIKNFLAYEWILLLSLLVITIFISDLFEYIFRCFFLTCTKSSLCELLSIYRFFLKPTWYIHNGRLLKLGRHNMRLLLCAFSLQKLGRHNNIFYYISAKSCGGTCLPGLPSTYGPVIFVHVLLISLSKYLHTY